MNPAPVQGIAFGPIIFIILLLTLIPGTILGWVAAKRIRQSEGKLYGLRLAALAGLFFPTILLVVISISSFAIVMRISVFSESLTEEEAMILGTVVFATFALLSVKVFQGCLRTILGKASFRESFELKRNRYLLVALIILWAGLGVIFFFQRPKQLDDYITSKSPDGELSARASTWHSRRIFQPDQTSYRFEIIDRGGTSKRVHQIPVAIAGHSQATTNFSETSDHWFSKIGAIQWEADSSEAIFLVNGSELFRTSVEENERGLTVAVAGVAESSSQSAKFGPVHTVIIPAPSDQTNMSFLDLDTGELVQTPDEIHALMRHRFNPDVPKQINVDQRFEPWAKQTGADLMISHLPYRNVALHMGTFSMPEYEFHQAEPYVANRVLTLMHPSILSRPTDDQLPPFTSCSLSKGQGSPTMMFATREGGIGVMQFLEETESPSGMKIRYMLLDR